MGGFRRTRSRGGITRYEAARRRTRSLQGRPKHRSIEPYFAVARFSFGRSNQLRQWKEVGLRRCRSKRAPRAHRARFYRVFKTNAKCAACPGGVTSISSHTRLQPGVPQAYFLASTFFTGRPQPSHSIRVNRQLSRGCEASPLRVYGMPGVPSRARMGKRSKSPSHRRRRA